MLQDGQCNTYNDYFTMYERNLAKVRHHIVSRKCSDLAGAIDTMDSLLADF